MVHFNVTREWFKSNSRHQKRSSEGGKKFSGCRGLLGRVISQKRVMTVSKGKSELRLPYDETTGTGETWVLLFMTR